MKRKMRMGSAGRWAMICSMSKEGEGEGEGEGGGGKEPTLDELQARLDALEGMKEKAVGESKAEREKRKAMETKIAEYEAKEKEREEAEAKERGEFEKLAADKDKEISTLKAKQFSATKKSGLKDGLSAINVAPQFREAVEAMFRDKVELDGDDAKIDGKSPTDFFKAWADTDQGKAFVQNGSSGGGAGGGSGTGGDKTEKKFSEMNATEKTMHLNMLKTTNPDEYQRLVKAYQG